jgi:hypothetical protein
VVVLQIRSCVTLAPNKFLPLFSDFGGIFENSKIFLHRNFVGGREGLVFFNYVIGDGTFRQLDGQFVEVRNPRVSVERENWTISIEFRLRVGGGGDSFERRH